MSGIGAGPARAAGFTLLEVMIAVVVFSIGLLGIAGLQLAGMRFTHGSQLRAIATMQAENMADRMRANAAGLMAGAYNITGTMPTAYTTDCDKDPCTPAQLATFDLVSWGAGVGSTSTKPQEGNGHLLPSGAGIVCLDTTPDDGEPGAWACDNAGFIYAIKVYWVERTSTGINEAGGNVDVGRNSDERVERLVLRVAP